MLLTKTAMREQGERVGLVLENVENFRLSYAKTLRLWRERFLERWPTIAKLGYDEAFRRKWVYYLSYCEAGFDEGSIDVGIYQYKKPAEANRSRLHLTATSTAPAPISATPIQFTGD